MIERNIMKDDENYTIKNGMLLFLGSVYSQWYTRKTLITDSDGTIYSSAEKYMMAWKARIFGDVDSLYKVLQIDNPRSIKQLGKGVKGFTDEVWNQHKMNVVTKANYYKFSQNEYLKQIMMKHMHLKLVEASPYDRIWGIGLHETNPKAWDESTWDGQNLLGEAIMSARTMILKDEGIEV